MCLAHGNNAVMPVRLEPAIDTLILFLKESEFEKGHQTIQQKHEKVPSIQRYMYHNQTTQMLWLICAYFDQIQQNWFSQDVGKIMMRNGGWLNEAEGYYFHRDRTGRHQNV